MDDILTEFIVNTRIDINNTPKTNPNDDDYSSMFPLHNEDELSHFENKF